MTAPPAPRLQRLRSSSLSHDSLWGSPEVWPAREESRAWVLVLNTGGTIGMGGTECGGGKLEAEEQEGVLFPVPVFRLGDVHEQGWVGVL